MAVNTVYELPHVIYSTYLSAARTAEIVCLFFLTLKIPTSLVHSTRRRLLGELF